MSDDNPIKRWNAKRKAAVVMDLFKGQHNPGAARLAGEARAGESVRDLEVGISPTASDSTGQHSPTLAKNLSTMSPFSLNTPKVTQCRRPPRPAITPSKTSG